MPLDAVEGQARQKLLDSGAPRLAYVPTRDTLREVLMKVPEACLAELGVVSFQRRYISKSLPLIITDGAARWMATRQWTFGNLKTRLGDKNVLVRFSESGLFDDNKAADTGGIKVLELTVSRAIEHILSENGFQYYIQQQGIEPSFPELLDDLGALPLLSPLDKTLFINLWIGGRGCRTPLHFDPTENFLVQVRGTKRVTLFPPHDTTYLYPAVGEKLEHLSRMNIFSPDYSRFPLFAKARPRTFLLRPPNVLYIPRGWWHAVESLDPSISVNHWWLGRIRLLLNDARDLLSRQVKTALSLLCRQWSGPVP
jgi:hypothetical protein